MFVEFCRDTGRKIEDPELLEAIRLTIISNMIEFHPVCGSLLMVLFTFMCLYAHAHIDRIVRTDFLIHLCTCMCDSSALCMFV
jgi:hypothetical protein